MHRKASVITWFLYLAVTILSGSFLAASPSQAAVGSWSSTGPEILATNNLTWGAIRSLALSSNFAQDQKIFAGGYSGHLHLSTDGGASWSAQDLNQIPPATSGSALSFHALAVAGDQKTVFVAGSAGSARVFRSDDGGYNWTDISNSVRNASGWLAPHWDVVVSPNYAADQTVFLAGNDKVARSSDGGNSWALKNTGLPDPCIIELAISPNFHLDKTIFAIGNNQGVFKSEDAGEHWFPMSNGLPRTSGYIGPCMNAIAISPDYANDHTLFVQVWGGGIFKSTDGGTSWSCVNNSAVNAPYGGLAISPNYVNDGTVIMASSSNNRYWVLVSRDRGVSWQELPAVPAPTTYGNSGPVAFSPNFANDQTIFTGVQAAVGEKGVYAYTFPPETNRPPTANAGPDQTKHAGQPVTLDGSASTDPDGDPITYSWSFKARPDGSAATLSDPTAAKPTFTLDQPGEYRLSLVVTDAKGAASAADEVIISTTNTAPVAKAGPDQTFDGLGMTVTLNGSQSYDPDQDAITYQWTMTAKPLDSAAQLTGADTVSPSFVVDKHGDYVINLTVKDTWEASSNTATVKVSSNNLKPVANAGAPRTVHVGTSITLDGSASADPDQNYPLTYAWTFATTPDGNIPSLSGANTPTPTFTPNKEGNYVLQLIVTDSLGVVSPAATVTISTNNSPPIADAGGNQSITKIGALVTLDGTASKDPDQGDTLTYQWSLTSKPAGSGAILNGDKTTTPTFVADIHGDYVAQLTVTDQWGASSSATVMVSFTNLAPVASAGPNQVAQAVGATINLDGSASYDDNGDSLTYSWSLAGKPAGSIAQIIPTPGNPAKASFVIDMHGDYVAELMVKDPFNASATAQARISFSNLPPVADAGPSQSAKVGDTVTMDGSRSLDPNLDPLTYAWSITSRPAGSSAALSGANSALASFLPDMPGAYVITLTVSDGFGEIASTNIQVQAFLNTQTVTAAIQTLEVIIADRVALPDNVFKNSNMRKTMTNKLNSVIANIEAKNYQEGLAQLENDLLQKTDGFYGGNPKNDWIQTQEAQAEIYPALVDIINKLKSIM